MVSARVSLVQRDREAEDDRRESSPAGVGMKGQYQITF